MESAQLLLRHIFGSADVTRRTELVVNGRKLIHYCSAENALKIIKNREIWLRNVRVMNDFMEVNHGFNLITRSMHTTGTEAVQRGLNAVKSALDLVHPGLADETFDQFRAWSPLIQNETYVTCLSEHLEDEEADGRLSMWRNYAAGQSGVGLIINTSMFGSDDDELGVYSSPVFYFSDKDADDMFQDVAQKITQCSQALSLLSRAEISGMYFLMLRSISHGSKHPGFKEEREWRIFHTYQLDGLKKLRMDTEVIAGVPQRILKLSLDGSIPGISVPELLSGILIGPSQYQNEIAMALQDELRKANVPITNNLIRFSPIPLRT